MHVEQKMFVKATPGRRLKDPYTLKVIAEEGEWKPRESYWMRAVLFGDAIECAPPETKAETPVKIEDEPTPKPTKRVKKHEPNDGRGENQ